MTGTLKPYKYPSRLRSTTRRAVRGVRNAAQNKTNIKAPKTEEYAHFGDRAESPTPETKRISTRAGLYTGIVGGSVGGAAVYGGQSSRDNRTLARYNRAKAKDIKKNDDPFNINKARAHLITDLGTQANRRWPKLSRGRLVAGGVAGTSLGVGASALGARTNRDELKRAYRNQNRGKQPVTKRAGLQRYQPTHKERAKMRATDAAYGAGTGVAITGIYHGVGNRTLKAIGAPKRMRKLPHAKGVYGTMAALGAANGLGHYKKDQYRVVQKSALSAFGVDHG